MKQLSPSLIKLVKLLSDGQFHDGTSIGNELHMTRAGVWKLIKKLEAYDIPLVSVKGKGYALTDPLILLDKSKIKKLLINKQIKLDVFESIDSTNDYLKQFYSDNKMRVCLAESQKRGKGRLNRAWHSPFGQNIYLSLFYPFSIDISALSGLSLVIGLSICKTIEKLYSLPEPLFVKWPNDIIYDHAKLAGILIEVQAETYGSCQAIMGIGLNTNMLDVQDTDITQKWQSLRKITGEVIDRNILCAELINCLNEDLLQFSQLGLNAFQSEWVSRDYLKGKSIKLKHLQNTIEGKVMGINEQGNILLAQTSGQITPFSSGEALILKN